MIGQVGHKWEGVAQIRRYLIVIVRTDVTPPYACGFVLLNTRVPRLARFPWVLDVPRLPL